LSDEELCDWFDAHPEFIPCVSDHMTWEFYETHWALARSREADMLFATEITVGGVYDFVLMTYDLGALAALRPSSTPTAGRHLDAFADSRILVTFAHPPLWDGGRGESWRDWLRQIPVDFLEYNAIRLLPSPYSLGRAGTRGAASGPGSALAEDNSRLLELRDDLFPHARFVVGSDSHQPDRLGTTYLEFAAPVASGREAWERLREGAFSGRLSLDGLGDFRVDPETGLTVELA